MAQIFDPEEERVTIFASPAFVIRFSVTKAEGEKNVLLYQVRAVVYGYSGLPKYTTPPQAFPVKVNPYLVTLVPPAGADPRPCIAELRYEHDPKGSFRFSPLVLDQDTPEVIDVRFNATQPGVYKVALEATVAQGGNHQTYRIMDQEDVMFIRFEP